MEWFMIRSVQWILSAVSCFFLLLLGVFFYPAPACAFDEFDTEHAPSRFSLSYEDLELEIKGRARIGLHDLSGKGGPEYDSPTDTATIGTRSPFVDLDSFDLSFRLNWDQIIWFNTNIYFTTDETALSAIYFEYRQSLSTWFSHGVEVGYQTPIMATYRHTVRYPLIATQYWKNPEYHLAYGARFDFAADTAITLYLAASFMRPLKSEPIHGSYEYSGSLKTLAYGSAKPFSGNAVSGSGLIRFFTHGFSLEAFGHLGNIVTKDGLNTLVSDFIYYRSLPNYNSEENTTLAWWAGGRMAYNGYGFHIMAETIASQEQLIKRLGMYVQASYTYTRDARFFNAFEVIARYEQTWLKDATKPIDDTHALRSPDTNNAITWDHKILTLAARLNIFKDILSARFEYHFFFEDNGVPKLNIKSVDFDDNELLFQLEARY